MMYLQLYDGVVYMEFPGQVVIYVLPSNVNLF